MIVRSPFFNGWEGGLIIMNLAMKLADVEDHLLDEITTTAKQMYAAPDVESEAFLLVQERVSSMNPRLAINILALALMTLAINSILENERKAVEEQNRLN